MGEVSANPGVMREYFLDGCQQLAQWQPELDRLREALEDVWRAFTDGHVPAEYCAGITAETADDLVGQCEQVKEDIRYSDQNVYDVAEAVAEADRFDFCINPADEVSWPEGVLTVDDSVLDGVGPASRMEAVELDAGPDAARGLELLADQGVVDALDDGLDNDELIEIATGIDSDGELAQWLEEVGPQLEEDPVYAAAFYNELGADGLEALAAVFLAAGGVADINNGRGWDEDPRPGAWVRHVADPFINGLADASRTGLLNTGDMDYHHIPTPTPPPGHPAGPPPDQPETPLDPYPPDPLLFDQLLNFETEHDRLAAAIMFSNEGNRYDPEILGRAAQAVLGTGQLYDQTGDYLTEADAFMTRALAENPAATAWFTVDHGTPLLDPHGDPLLDATGQPAINYTTVDDYLNILINADTDYTHLNDPYGGHNIENVWFNEDWAGNLANMHQLWAATAYTHLWQGHVDYEFRDFNGDPIQGHPWRNNDLLLGDSRFLDNYQGSHDPTDRAANTYYTLWLGEPGGELAPHPSSFFYDYSPQHLSDFQDVLPFYGQWKAFNEARTGVNDVTGEELTTTDRWLAGISFAIGGALWTAGAYPTTKAILNTTRTFLHNHPPIPRITASAHMPEPDPLPARIPTSDYVTFVNHSGRSNVPAYRAVISASNWSRARRELSAYAQIHSIDLNTASVPNTAEFDHMLNVADGKLIYVVHTDGSLTLAPRYIDGEKMSHPALVNDPNESVLAAGEVNIKLVDDVDSSGFYTHSYQVTGLDNVSGQFVPHSSSLEGVAVPAFEAHGLHVSSLGQTVEWEKWW